MVTVKREFADIYEVKRSKFISHIAPYSQFDSLLSRLKDEHPKARHFVYAFRYKNEFGQIVEGSSDDGEPKGTSGKPTLNVVAGAELIDTVLITVRYFGGIKLGTGGLVKAYSNSANLVINSSELEDYREMVERNYNIDYSDISRFEYQVQKLQLAITSKEFHNSGGTFTVRGEEETLSAVKYPAVNGETS